MAADDTRDVVDKDRELREREQRSKEHAPHERSPDERAGDPLDDDERKPAPPGQAQLPRG